MCVLGGKAPLQSLHRPVLLELPQRTGAELRPRPIVQLQQPRPQLRVVPAQLPQLVDLLEWAAPAGGTAVNLIKAAEIKAPVIADLQGLRLRDAPFDERIPLVRILFAAYRFICGDADVMERVLLPFEPVDLLIHKMGLELAGTPAHPDTRPAISKTGDAEPLGCA